MNDIMAKHRNLCFILFNLRILILLLISVPKSVQYKIKFLNSLVISNFGKLIHADIVICHLMTSGFEN